MADKQLRYVVTGVDQGASKVIGSVGDKAESSSKRIGAAFGKAGSMIGGEFGELLSKVGDGFDQLGERGGASLGKKLAIGGAAIAGLGGALTAMGDKEKAASQQLDVAIQNSGHTVDEYGKRIDETVHHMEKYAHSAVDTKTALTTLTNATHDPAKALDLMAEAADLAAVKGISLNDAASVLAKGLNGSTKIFKQYGIVVQTNSDGTKDYAGAVAALGKELHGQADAAANTFTGRLKALKTEITDGAAALGQKYGPAITTIGVGMIAFAPIAEKAVGAIKAIGARFGTMASTAVEADATALASTGTLAAGVEGSAATQIGALGSVDAAAVSTSATAVASDTAAEESTTALATAVSASAGTQVAAMGTVGTAATVEAATIARAQTSIAGATAGAGVATAGAGAGAAVAVSKFGKFAAIAPKVGAALFIAATAATVYSEATTKQNANSEQTRVLMAKLDDTYGKFGVTSDQITAGVSGTDAQFATFTNTLAGHRKATALDKIALDDLHSILKGTAAATDEAAAATAADSETIGWHAAILGTNDSALAAATKSASGQAASAAAATLAMQVENDAVGLLTQSFNTLNGQEIGAEEANIAFRNSEDAITDSVKQNGRSLNDNTVKGRANVSAVLSSIKAAQAHAEAVAQQTGVVAKGTAQYNSDIAALKARLTQLHFTPAAIAAIIAKYGAMPKIVLTDAELRDYATPKINSIRSKLDGINGYRVTTYIDTVSSQITDKRAGSHTTGAGGAEFAEGGAMLVGERGAEIVDLPRGSKVHQTMSHVAGGSSAAGRGGVIELHIHTPQIYGGSSPALVRQIIAAIETHVGAGGKIRALRGLN